MVLLLRVSRTYAQGVKASHSSSRSNVRKGVPYRFNFLNLYKSDSFYNHGLLPLMYSVTNASNGVGWVRTGTQGTASSVSRVHPL